MRFGRWSEGATLFQRKVVLRSGAIVLILDVESASHVVGVDQQQDPWLPPSHWSFPQLL